MSSPPRCTGWWNCACKTTLLPAGELQVALKPLCDALFCEVNPIPVKTALNLMGWEAGPLRLPLCQPSEEHLQLLQSTLAEYGLLPES